MTHFNAVAVRKHIPFMIASAIGTFVLGLLLNAYYQAGIYNDRLSQNATIGAFVRADGKVPGEVMKERLVNLDGVADVQFVSKEQVLDRAVQADPAIKEVMVSGENPFVPYFVIRPAQVAAGPLQTLVEQVQKVEGIEEVRYDANLVSVSEQLARFRSLYRIAFEGSAAAAFLVILYRLIVRWTSRKLDGSRYLLLLATGLAASIAGTLAYYFYGAHAVQSELVQLPNRYLAYLLLSGIALAFAGESD